MRRVIPLLLLLATLFSGPLALSVHAQSGGQNDISPPTGGQNDISPNGGSDSSSGLVNPLNKIDSLQDFMNAILDAVVEIGSIILLLALVYTGFLFVAAQGNVEKLRNARSALVWTVVGGLVLLGAKTIGLVIESTASSLK